MKNNQAEENLAMVKCCSVCEQSKPLNDFHKNTRSKKDGLTAACKVCRAKRSQNDYNKHRSARRQKQAEWHAANSQSVSVRKSKYHQDNREKRVAHSKEWYYLNKERQLSAQKIWKRANPEKVRIMSQRGTRVRRTRLDGSGISTKEWMAIRERSNHCCIYCGKKTTLLHIEHFQPVSKGGLTTLNNIVPACGFCNKSKFNHDPHLWISQRFGEETLQRVINFLDNV